MTLAPIRREILVDADPALAFELFTRDIGMWWPLGDFGVHGSDATVSFEGDGRLVERAPSGSSTCWGEVTVWERPGRLAFTWHPGDPSVVTSVSITFQPREAQTLVVLEHRGWENCADPGGARRDYDHGWPVVLERYVAHQIRVAGEPDPSSSTWIALRHRPGPGAPEDGSLFAHPTFREHVAFLERMRASGYLVAAGSFGDVPGDGMTILRLPGPDRLDEAARLATEDDLSVASGFFAVTVRPWQVVLAAI